MWMFGRLMDYNADKGAVHSRLHMKYDLPVVLRGPENSHQVLHPI